MILVILTGWMFVRKAEPTEVELDHLHKWLKPQNSDIAPSALYDMLDAELARYRAEGPKAEPRSTMTLVLRAEPEAPAQPRSEPRMRVKVSPYIFACPTCEAVVDEPCRNLRALRDGRLQEVAPHPARRALAAERRQQ